MDLPASLRRWRGAPGFFLDFLSAMTTLLEQFAYHTAAHSSKRRSAAEIARRRSPAWPSKCGKTFAPAGATFNGGRTSNSKKGIFCMAQYDYDLFTIGAGSGGVRASRMSASFGARAAIAEELYLGGTCVNVGCIPKKLLVYAAHYADDFADAAGYGWTVG